MTFEDKLELKPSNIVNEAEIDEETPLTDWVGSVLNECSLMAHEIDAEYSNIFYGLTLYWDPSVEKDKVPVAFALREDVGPDMYMAGIKETYAIGAYMQDKPDELIFWFFWILRRIRQHSDFSWVFGQCGDLSSREWDSLMRDTSDKDRVSLMNGSECIQDANVFALALTMLNNPQLDLETFPLPITNRIQTVRKVREFLVTDEDVVAYLTAHPEKREALGIELHELGSEPQKEPAAHDPCPCGSGKKYRNCCGRVGKKSASKHKKRKK